jgi:hypothetical protein
MLKGTCYSANGKQEAKALPATCGLSKGLGFFPLYPAAA